MVGARVTSGTLRTEGLKHHETRPSALGISDPIVEPLEKTTSEMYVASLTLLILDFRISTVRYSTFRYSSFDTRHFDTRVSILDFLILDFLILEF